MVNSAEQLRVPRPVEYVPSRFTLHCFASEVGPAKVLYQVIKLKDSLLIFIGEKGRFDFTDLSMAMPSRYGAQPLGTKVVGDLMDDTSKEIACRVAKKLRKTVHVSLNMVPDKHLTPMVERQLFVEMKERPEMF